MVPQDAIRRLIHEVDTLLRTFPFDLCKARDIGSRWSGADDSPIPAGIELDDKLYSLEFVLKEDEARELSREILNLAEGERE